MNLKKKKEWRDKLAKSGHWYLLEEEYIEEYKNLIRGRGVLSFPRKTHPWETSMAYYEEQKHFQEAWRKLEKFKCFKCGAKKGVACGCSTTVEGHYYYFWGSRAAGHGTLSKKIDAKEDNDMAKALNNMRYEAMVDVFDEKRKKIESKLLTLG